MKPTPRCPTAALAVGCTAFSFATVPADAASTKPAINIGVIAPFSAIDGASIINGAEMAVDDINAQGGIDGSPIKLFKYDDKASTTDAPRAFGRYSRITSSRCLASSPARSPSQWNLGPHALHYHRRCEQRNHKARPRGL